MPASLSRWSIIGMLAIWCVAIHLTGCRSTGGPSYRSSSANQRWGSRLGWFSWGKDKPPATSLSSNTPGTQYPPLPSARTGYGIPPGPPASGGAVASMGGYGSPQYPNTSQAGVPYPAGGPNYSPYQPGAPVAHQTPSPAAGYQWGQPPATGVQNGFYSTGQTPPAGGQRNVYTADTRGGGPAQGFPPAGNPYGSPPQQPPQQPLQQQGGQNTYDPYGGYGGGYNHATPPASNAGGYVAPNAPPAGPWQGSPPPSGAPGGYQAYPGNTVGPHGNNQPSNWNSNGGSDASSRYGGVAPTGGSQVGASRYEASSSSFTAPVGPVAPTHGGASRIQPWTPGSTKAYAPQDPPGSAPSGPTQGVAPAVYNPPVNPTAGPSFYDQRHRSPAPIVSPGSYQN